VRPIDADQDKLLLENFTDEDNAFYVLHVVRVNGGGELQLARTIWFNRYNLTLSRQLIFDAAGNILTDARYTDWRRYDNVAFPSTSKSTARTTSTRGDRYREDGHQQGRIGR